MTKDQFNDKVNHLFISKREFNRLLKKLIKKGAITERDIENMPDNYLPVYPIVAAIYESATLWYVNGSSYKETRSRARKKCNEYKSYL